MTIFMDLALLGLGLAEVIALGLAVGRPTGDVANAVAMETRLALPIASTRFTADIAETTRVESWRGWLSFC